MLRTRVLVIDDDLGVRRIADEILKSQGVQVFLAADGRSGIDLLRRRPIDVLFTDLRLPDDDGMSIVQQALWIRPMIRSVIVTGYPSFESSVSALQKGVCDYITKPLTRQNVIAALARATAKLEGKEGRRDSSALEGPAVMAASPEVFIAVSLAMRKLLALATKVAALNVSVLIQGETGVGKTRLARYIHEQSLRSAKPFRHFPCKEVREDQIESMLSEEAGNGSSRIGYGTESPQRQMAGGTLFLDDVGELPVWAQAKLLNIFDGDLGTTSDQVRVIASTSSDLQAQLHQGRFCSNLYDYLKASSIRVPPLRERKEAIRPLADHFVALCLEQQDASTANQRFQLSEQAWEYLSGYDWPGNVRELVNFIKRAVLVHNNGQCDADSAAELLRVNRPCSKQVNTVTVPLDGNLKKIERHIVREVIERFQGNKAAAARSLNMHRRTIYRLLQDDRTE